MKTCKRCGGKKPVEAYHLLVVNGGFYRQSYCKLCQRILARERYRREYVG